MEEAMRTYEKQPYITERAHAGYPAGSKVLATKTYQNVLQLEYEDGVIIEIYGGWCSGLDDAPPKGKTIWDLMNEQIKLEMDAEILGELDAIIKEVEVKNEQARNELSKPPGTDS